MKFIAIFPNETDKSLVSLSAGVSLSSSGIAAARSAIEDWKVEEGGEEGAGELEPEENVGLGSGSGDADLLLLNANASSSEEEDSSASDTFLLGVLRRRETARE